MASQQHHCSPNWVTFEDLHESMNSLLLLDLYRRFMKAVKIK